MILNLKQKILCATILLLAFFTFKGIVNASTTDIIFTEIMYNPSSSDTKKEWVEIYNSGSSAVTIIEGSGTDSWRFNDGSNHTLTLLQGDLTISSGGYAILASDAQTFLDDHTGFTGTIIDTVLSLNNTSDTIKLSSDKGESFFGDVTYDDTLGADGDGNSLQLSGSTWAGNTETPGAANASQESEPAEEAASESSSSSGGGGSSSESSTSTEETTTSETTIQTGDPTKVKITEIFPNPIGNEQQEFIELWNDDDESISLDGWKIADASKIKTLSGITLIPGEYYTLYRTATGIALNNSSETIYLYSSDGTLIDTYEYSSTIEDYSISFDIKKDAFLWSSTKTPSKQNLITTPNDPPIAVITFEDNPVAPLEKFIISGLDSTDADDDPLSYFWTIGKSFQAYGPQFSYSFSELGSYTVNLIVSDEYYEVSASSVIQVLPSYDVLSLRIEQNNSNKPITTTTITTSPQATTTAQIYITEIFPNPSGRDDSEWIELYNPNEFDVILDNWIIDDEDGGSRPHTIQDRIIKAKSYLILGKEETKITLNNSSDEVRLFNSDDKLIDEVLYDDVIENQSYTKSDEGFWYWTSDTTSGEPNEIIAQDDFVAFGLAEVTPDNAFSTSDIVDIDLPNIRELDLGTEVRVQGTVAVEPGILAKTYFYITGSPGVQVYFSKKDWPSIVVGDVVGVIGELSESNNELRLKVTDKSDIVPLYASDPPIPQDTATGEVGESMEGALVKLTAELMQKKGTSWFIDDGTGEAKMTFQPSANLIKPNVKTGQWLEVIGLVSETRSGYRVLPRYQEDIREIDMEKVVDEDTGQVLGAFNSNDDIARFRIPANNSSQKIMTYLLITSTALIILLAGLLIKFRVESNKRLKELENKK
jgi:DNA/RNA endonuclease YhcR with UshA esterase domain